MSVEGISGGESAAQEAVAQAPQAEVSGEQTQEVQTPPAPQEPQNKFDDKVAAKFAALSRKEKAIKAQEQALKQRETELMNRLKEKEAEAEKYRTEHENYRNSIKASPLQKLQEDYGLTFEDLTKMELNDRNPTPEMLIKKSQTEVESKLTAKIEALEKALAEKEEKALQEQEDRTVKTYKKQIADMVTTDTDRYELINVNYDAQSAADEIYEIIELKYKESEGEVILSTDEAADYLENYLLNLAKKNLNAKKLAAQSAPKPQPTSEKQESVTLSNTLSAEVPKGSSKVLSRDEEIELASKLLRWE
jgi:hypothetical protein